MQDLTTQDVPNSLRNAGLLVVNYATRGVYYIVGDLREAVESLAGKNKIVNLIYSQVNTQQLSNFTLSEEDQKVLLDLLNIDLAGTLEPSLSAILEGTTGIFAKIATSNIDEHEEFSPEIIQKLQQIALDKENSKLASLNALQGIGNSNNLALMFETAIAMRDQGNEDAMKCFEIACEPIKTKLLNIAKTAEADESSIQQITALSKNTRHLLAKEALSALRAIVKNGYKIDAELADSLVNRLFGDVLSLRDPSFKILNLSKNVLNENQKYDIDCFKSTRVYNSANEKLLNNELLKLADFASKGKAMTENELFIVNLALAKREGKTFESSVYAINIVINSANNGQKLDSAIIEKLEKYLDLDSMLTLETKESVHNAIKGLKSDAVLALNSIRKQEGTVIAESTQLKLVELLKNNKVKEEVKNLIIEGFGQADIRTPSLEVTKSLIEYLPFTENNVQKINIFYAVAEKEDEAAKALVRQALTLPLVPEEILPQLEPVFNYLF